MHILKKALWFSSMLLTHGHIIIKLMPLWMKYCNSLDDNVFLIKMGLLNSAIACRHHIYPWVALKDLNFFMLFRFFPVKKKQMWTFFDVFVEGIISLLENVVIHKRTCLSSLWITLIISVLEVSISQREAIICGCLLYVHIAWDYLSFKDLYPLAEIAKLIKAKLKIENFLKCNC